MSANSPEDLQRIYENRFAGRREYRDKMWETLVSSWFSRYLVGAEDVLDLGCGYGEFINAVSSPNRYAMDLNPDARKFLDADITFLNQNCATPWSLPDASLDVVITSNFFEHLPDKAAIGHALDEARRCLRPGGRIVAIGPNIKHLPGKYWDFWDHHVALSEVSLQEALISRGFEVPVCVGKFLPFTASNRPQYPLVFLRAYLKLRVAWRVFGKQFLVVGTRPSA